MKKIILSMVSFLLLTGVAKSAKLDDPLNIGGENAAEILTARIIKAMLLLSGVLALVFFIWGAVLWTSSAGNPEQIKKGRQTMLWALVGMIVIFAAYIIVRSTLNILSF
jgi:small-conductance mechanosensitive channel